MKGLVEGFVIGTLAFVVVAFAALIGGTIVYLIWPVAIPAAFPGLVASGAIAAQLSWWQAVALTWVFGILVKASSSATVNKK